ncbi:MAG: hypothetical protein BWX86_02483 [Verrucomicrobia bacterium ADurb.Bin122]|nr:MAG: hypothetical protein BWX86_02483 [Verrucomicrobia bacterium ADurb.Bin122]
MYAALMASVDWPASAATSLALRLSTAPRPWQAAEQTPSTSPSGRTATVFLPGKNATATPTRIVVLQTICAGERVVPSQSHSASAAIGVARHCVMSTLSRAPTIGIP